jgi:hypothetical protein
MPPLSPVRVVSIVPHDEPADTVIPRVDPGHRTRLEPHVQPRAAATGDAGQDRPSRRGRAPPRSDSEHRRRARDRPPLIAPRASDSDYRQCRPVQRRPGHRPRRRRRIRPFDHA